MGTVRGTMLAILARLLMLVACGPLLLPPGICVCKAGHQGRASASREVIGDGGSVVHPATTCCAKGRCTETAGKVTSSQSGQTSKSKQPAPTDDQHLPGCPASPTADAYKWVEPSQSATSVLPPLEVVALQRAEVVFIAASIPTSTNWLSSPPLYLSHCSLVI